MGTEQIIHEFSPIEREKKIASGRISAGHLRPAYTTSKTRLELNYTWIWFFHSSLMVVEQRFVRFRDWTNSQERESTAYLFANFGAKSKIFVEFMETLRFFGFLNLQLLGKIVSKELQITEKVWSVPNEFSWFPKVGKNFTILGHLQLRVTRVKK